MPTLFLHSGLFKTGTTTLQKTFFDNRARLQEQGVLYPLSGLSDHPGHWGHHSLAREMHGPHKARAAWTALRAELETENVRTAFVSSEELSTLPLPTLPGLQPYTILKEVFDGWDIRILCYLRPQADYLASLYNHHVKSVGETGDIFGFLGRMAPRLDYDYYLNVAATALGPDAMIVRRYLPKGTDGAPFDIVDDVAKVIDIDPGALQRAHRPLNPGLTERGVEKMLAANRRYSGDPDALQKARQLILRLHRAAPFKSANPVGADMRKTLFETYRLKNQHIARRYMKERGDLFAPDDGSAPPLTD
ncbi:hypothetical protein [Sulfitobacter sp. S190]|uniref:hypothetical protein n=1 Tax=Sulfitobacter sp. S190 TaxID=2867022 RepID=UPI0021A927CB|nr:hypothetical protein [Sulfitobacter sp. S190]UWR24451.1 hypothetical protein K3756_18295 [Sulfitobacter sp. S190]